MVNREATTMPLVKVKPKFQLTLPAKIRQAAGIQEGDLLDVSVSAEGIIFKPQTIINKKKLVEQMKRILAEPVADNPFAGLNDDQIMQEAIRIIKDVRDPSSAT